MVALVGHAASASALSSLANIFNPDVIVIGGGVIAAGDLLLEPAREELRKRAPAADERDAGRAAELGGDAGMIGAAAMALEESGASASRPVRLGSQRCPASSPSARRRSGTSATSPPRARTALAEADMSPARTRGGPGRLFELLEIPAPRLVSYHERNEAERARELAQGIERGDVGRARLRRRHARRSPTPATG